MTDVTNQSIENLAQQLHRDSLVLIRVGPQDGKNISVTLQQSIFRNICQQFDELLADHIWTEGESRPLLLPDVNPDHWLTLLSWVVYRTLPTEVTWQRAAAAWYFGHANGIPFFQNACMVRILEQIRATPLRIADIKDIVALYSAETKLTTLLAEEVSYVDLSGQVSAADMKLLEGTGRFLVTVLKMRREMSKDWQKAVDRLGSIENGAKGPVSRWADFMVGDVHPLVKGMRDQE